MSLNPPLKYYCDENAFRFHILDVGEGLMILIIFPDNKVMLFDCNVTEENADEILNYLDKNIPLNYNEDTDSEEKIIHFFVNRLLTPKFNKCFFERTNFTQRSVNRIFFITVFYLHKILCYLNNIVEVNDKTIVRLGE